MPCASLPIWERIRQALAQLRSDHYRPEQHYMSGYFRKVKKNWVEKSSLLTPENNLGLSKF